MAIADRNYDSRLSFGSKINPLVVLIAIAMIIFVVLMFFRALAYVKMPQSADIDSFFINKILSWFALSADGNRSLDRPWTLLTYAFAYSNVWQLFASLIWLWAFGYILIDLTGFKKIAPVFLYGTLAGAAAYILANSMIPANGVKEVSYLFGGGAAVLAVCTAATTICPNYKIFPMLGGGISLWILSIIYLVIDLATLPANGPVLYIAHLAGALSGFLFIFFLRRGIDGSDWMNNLYDWLVNLFNPDKPQKTRDRVKSTLFYKATKAPFAKTPKLTQQKLDEILDKINQFGYERLSAEEKEFLKRIGNEDMKDR